MNVGHLITALLMRRLRSLRTKIKEEYYVHAIHCTTTSSTGPFSVFTYLTLIHHLGLIPQG
jgi:hypothetical protein